jgi:hypothetical protein
MAAIPVKTADGKGRVTLGKEFAHRLVMVMPVAEGVVQVIRAEAVPERESWLYKNPKALRMVMEGIVQAKAGELADGPDLEADAKVAGAGEE